MKYKQRPICFWKTAQEYTSLPKLLKNINGVVTVIRLD